MSRIFNSLEILKLFNAEDLDTQDISIKLGYVFFKNDIRPFCRKLINLTFSERKFWRYIKAFRNGRGDGQAVF
jgi:hypothetical protein